LHSAVERKRSLAVAVKNGSKKPKPKKSIHKRPAKSRGGKVENA